LPQLPSPASPDQQRAVRGLEALQWETIASPALSSGVAGAQVGVSQSWLAGQLQSGCAIPASLPGLFWSAPTGAPHTLIPNYPTQIPPSGQQQATRVGSGQHHDDNILTPGTAVASSTGVPQVWTEFSKLRRRTPTSSHPATFPRRQQTTPTHERPQPELALDDSQPVPLGCSVRQYAACACPWMQVPAQQHYPNCVREHVTRHVHE